MDVPFKQFKAEQGFPLLPRGGIYCWPSDYHASSYAIQPRPNRRPSRRITIIVRWMVAAWVVSNRICPNCRSVSAVDEAMGADTRQGAADASMTGCWLAVDSLFILCSLPFLCCSSAPQGLVGWSA